LHAYVWKAVCEHVISAFWSMYYRESVHC